MYRLSSHCEVPIAGMLLTVCTLIVITVASVLFRRYKKKQDRIKDKLRLDLYRQKQLVKTKQTDINLLTSAWKLSATEIRVEERIAAGAYGEVWRGALHNRWIVAIKKLFPSSKQSSNSPRSSSKNKKTGTVSRKRAPSGSVLFQDDEVKFLMRTRHERLVMFLGCGIAEDGGCFLVTEFMDGTSFLLFLSTHTHTHTLLTNQKQGVVWIVYCGEVDLEPRSPPHGYNAFRSCLTLQMDSLIFTWYTRAFTLT